MERSLTMGALAMAGLGWICGMAAARARGTAKAPPIAPLYWILAVSLPAVFWLVTLPEAPPFGVGHASGNGVALGAIAALIGAWSLLKFADFSNEDSRSAGFAAFLALGAVAAIAPLVLLKQGRLDALMGVGIGWLSALFLLSLGAPSLPLAKAAAWGVTVCACIGMGVFRDAMMPGAQSGAWSALMAIFAGSVPFVLLLCALPADLAARQMPLPRLLGPGSASRGWQVVLAALLLLILAQLLATKIADKPALLFCAALGAVAGFVAWRLCRESAENSLLGAFVLLAAFIVSYRLMQGFGGGVMMLCAWVASLGEWSSDEWSEIRAPFTAHHSPLTNLLAFGAAAMLYRFAATRFRLEADALELDEYFSFFGLLIGAVLPPFLARLQNARGENSLGETLLRALAGGALLIAAPLVAVMLWGAKSALILTAGAALGLLLIQEKRARTAPLFFALGGALAVAQWTKHALPLYEIARMDKAKLLGGGTLALVLLLIVMDFVSRRTAPENEVAL
jgi:hypothetical protein